MRLSKAQKAALLFGAFSVIADQISDVWMGLDYHFNCHYHWSRTSFILTFWHLPMFSLISNLTCYQDIRARCITTIQGIFSPFWMFYCVIQTLRSDNQNVIFDRIASVRIHKLIEVVVESFWQLQFNLYTRAYMDSLSAIHLTSISLSFLALLNALSDMFACLHGRTQTPRLLDVVKSMIFWSIHWVSIFGSITIAIRLFRFYCLPICLSIFIIVMTCIHIYICKGESQVFGNQTKELVCCR